MSPSNRNFNRVGTIVAGVFMMFLAVLVMMPMPSDGGWYWLPFPFSPWLEFIIGVPLFVMSLWLVIDSLRVSALPHSSSTAPLVDEWISEQGNETEEISHCKKYLNSDEKVLAIVAAREEYGMNRLALTDKRVVFYPRGNFQGGLIFGYGEIDSVQGRHDRFLTHLGEINVSAKGIDVTLKKVGVEYVDKIIRMITEMKRKRIFQSD